VPVSDTHIFVSFVSRVHVSGDLASKKTQAFHMLMIHEHNKIQQLFIHEILRRKAFI
jgi:hypothetical protein